MRNGKLYSVCHGISCCVRQVANPVPRCKHPDWLHKKLLEKNDVFRQKKISEMFMPSAAAAQPNSQSQASEDLFSQSPPSGGGASGRAVDIEDVAGKPAARTSQPVTTKRKRGGVTSSVATEDELNKSWRELLGDPPPMGDTKVRAGVTSHYQYAGNVVDACVK